MPDVVVDSNVVVGARMRRDQWHELGEAIVREIDAGNLPRGHANFYALAEVLTPIERRAGDGPALETLDFLTASRRFELVHTSQEDVTRGLAIYRRQPRLTFVDATTVAYMRRVGLEFIYSFDDDFDSLEDVTRLDTPDDPFA